MTSPPRKESPHVCMGPRELGCMHTCTPAHTYTHILPGSTREGFYSQPGFRAASQCSSMAPERRNEVSPLLYVRTGRPHLGGDLDSMGVNPTNLTGLHHCCFGSCSPNLLLRKEEHIQLALSWCFPCGVGFCGEQYTAPPMASHPARTLPQVCPDSHLLCSPASESDRLFSYWSPYQGSRLEWPFHFLTS